VLALAFPLHPPRRPERSRAHELAAGGLPVLVVQGTRDALGTPGEFPPDTTVVAVPDADHSFAVPKRAPTTPADVERLLVETVLDWLRTLLQRP
jgi:predicted alpha/beta-hydrolase family hydrolase